VGHKATFRTNLLPPSPHHLQDYITKMEAEGYFEITINLTRLHGVTTQNIDILTNPRYKISNFIRAHEITMQYTLYAPRHATRTTRSSVIYQRRTPLPVKIMRDQKQLDNVESFKYLGSILTNDGRCTCEIKCTISMAKAAFNKKRTLFTSTLDLELRKKLVKCYVWSIALYGAETWTLRAVDQKHLENFEMWCWRRMEKISWTDHVRNEDVLLA